MNVQFTEGLETIGREAFFGSGFESVQLPGSLRTIAQGAFAKCDNLTVVQFSEGLETLGTH